MSGEPPGPRNQDRNSQARQNPKARRAIREKGERKKKGHGKGQRKGKNRERERERKSKLLTRKGKGKEKMKTLKLFIGIIFIISFSNLSKAEVKKDCSMIKIDTISG